MVQDGKQAGGVDPNEPVRPLTAPGGGKEIVILLTVSQLTESLLNGAVLHRGNPEAADGLFTSCHLIDVAEDKLALTPCVAGVDHIGHIFTVHQLFQRFKLAVLVSGNFVLPVCRNDRKVVIPPFGILFIIGVGIGEFRQMTESPGHDIIQTFDVAVLTVSYTEDRGNRHSHRGLFSNYKSFHSHFSPCLSGRRMLSPVHAPRGAFSDTSRK